MSDVINDGGGLCLPALCCCLVVLVFARDVAAQGTRACESRAMRPSAGVALALTDMNVRVQTEVIPPTGDEQFSAQNGLGVSVAGEVPINHKYGVRVEIERTELGINRTTFSFERGVTTVRSVVHVGRVEMSQLLVGVVRHSDFDSRFCTYGVAAAGVHRFSYAGFTESGASVSGGLGLDVSVSDAASAFVEGRINAADNRSQPPLNALTVFSAALFTGIRYRF